MTRPHLLVLGHVTRDEVGDELRLGGAASYAALAAARLGVDTALVTVAPPDDPLLAPLRDTPGLIVHCVASTEMTTFVVEYEGARRLLALRVRARTLTIEDVPPAWRRPAVAYVGPVAGECDRTLIQSLHAGYLGVGLQGWLRRAAPDGQIEPALAPEALDPPRVGVAIVSEADHPDVEGVAARFAAAGAIVAITRGARGATLLTPSARLEIGAAQAVEVDPTGAGDVFGVVLTLRLAAGASPAQAAAAAAESAARVVEGPGLGRLG